MHAGGITGQRYGVGYGIGPPVWPARVAVRWRRGRGRGEHAARGGRGGRLMRHAGATAQAIGALPIAMVQPALGALLVPSPRRAEAAGPAGPPTREAAIGVAAIAGGTQEEGLPAPPARPHEEGRHGPAGPERSGGQWTSTRECATREASRPRPRGVGVPGGLEGSAPGPHPFPSGVAAAYLKITMPFHSQRQDVRIFTLLDG